MYIPSWVEICNLDPSKIGEGMLCGIMKKVSLDYKSTTFNWFYVL